MHLRLNSRCLQEIVSSTNCALHHFSGHRQLLISKQKTQAKNSKDLRTQIKQTLLSKLKDLQVKKAKLESLKTSNKILKGFDASSIHLDDAKDCQNAVVDDLQLIVHQLKTLKRRIAQK